MVKKFCPFDVVSCTRVRSRMTWHMIDLSTWMAVKLVRMIESLRWVPFKADWVRSHWMFLRGGAVIVKAAFHRKSPPFQFVDSIAQLSRRIPWIPLSFELSNHWNAIPRNFWWNTHEKCIKQSSSLKPAISLSWLSSVHVGSMSAQKGKTKPEQLCKWRGLCLVSRETRQ